MMMIMVQQDRRIFIVLIFLIGFIHVLRIYPSYIVNKGTSESYAYKGDEPLSSAKNTTKHDSPLFGLLPSLILQEKHTQRYTDLEAEQLEMILLDFLSSGKETSISTIYKNYTHRDGREIYSKIILDMSTPQGMAFHWLLHVDEYISKHQPSNEAILQRYILTLLFFCTEGEYNYRLGSRFTPDANTKAKWTRIGHLGFLSKLVNECHWNKRIKGSKAQQVLGVVCDNHGQVIEIHLGGISLDGFIPEELGLLTGLKKLVLNDNHLKGTIPRSLGAMTNLQLLDLSGNQLMGSVPRELGSLVQLESMFLQSNRIHGNSDTRIIPTEICQLFKVGKLMDVWIDCSLDVGPFLCDCCTKCF
mmetsp:Transcript_8204/g.15439  ORF Transcript_8204/g.15439 Transcript_8204/m.15439 type:complete len:359 (+) Transcript_8204:48-1124(+)